MSKVMAVVRVLPANNVSAADDSHDGRNLPQHLVILMMCDKDSEVGGGLEAIAEHRLEA